jgi:hypothetical protein
MNDLDDAMKVIWNALHGFREDCIPEGDIHYDEQWDEICTAMANITERLTHENLPR